jgi:hypothetical protein
VWADITKLIVAFRNFANAPANRAIVPRFVLSVNISYCTMLSAGGQTNEGQNDSRDDSKNFYSQITSKHDQKGFIL